MKFFWKKYRAVIIHKEGRITVIIAGRSYPRLKCKIGKYTQNECLKELPEYNINIHQWLWISNKRHARENSGQINQNSC